MFVTSAYVTERIISATSISPCKYFAYLDYTSTLKSRLDMKIVVFKKKKLRFRIITNIFSYSYKIFRRPNIKSCNH